MLELFNLLAKIFAYSLNNYIQKKLILFNHDKTFHLLLNTNLKKKSLNFILHSYVKIIFIVLYNIGP